MFCELMNLPQPSTRFAPYNKRLLNAVKLVSEETMQKAAQEAIRKNGNNKNIAVAVDGTWQKRGYSSLNGVVIVSSVETRKVMMWKFYLSTVCAVIKVLIKKDCKHNFEGSSGSMEVEGA
ncbi:uncharacterized protein NPIL_178181 [Nephila pilipes]|uniref:Mutator-like transposase domain-containing protein n=1 Tax=Nephila pilipes TaxID=299642 RepID=A0A8X6TSW5_NEPPI|nr:uncharacterized protein NPIL_178181 [Nephila pilipes]